MRLLRANARLLPRCVVLAGVRRASQSSQRPCDFWSPVQASNLHRAMAAAAALTVQLWSLDPGAQHGPAETAALLRTLCEALAEGHALMEGDAGLAFVRLCMGELRGAMEAMRQEHGGGELRTFMRQPTRTEQQRSWRHLCAVALVLWHVLACIACSRRWEAAPRWPLPGVPAPNVVLLPKTPLPPAGLSDGEEGEEGAPTPSDLYWELKAGLHSCLYWLLGLELPGREADPWAEGYEVGRAGGRFGCWAGVDGVRAAQGGRRGMLAGPQCASCFPMHARLLACFSNRRASAESISLPFRA